MIKYAAGEDKRAGFSTLFALLKKITKRRLRRGGN